MAKVKLPEPVVTISSEGETCLMFVQNGEPIGGINMTRAMGHILSDLFGWDRPTRQRR